MRVCVFVCALAERASPLYVMDNPCSPSREPEQLHRIVWFGALFYERKLVMSWNAGLVHQDSKKGHRESREEHLRQLGTA